jgi:hypothetical protein
MDKVLVGLAPPPPRVLGFLSQHISANITQRFTSLNLPLTDEQTGKYL